MFYINALPPRWIDATTAAAAHHSNSEIYGLRKVLLLIRTLLTHVPRIVVAQLLTGQLI